MKKRICLLTAAVLMLVPVVSAGAPAGEEVRIKVNGEKVLLDSAPFIENDRVLTPLRGVFERLGAGVDWIQEEQAVIISADGLTVTLIIGQNSAEVVRDGDTGPVTETVQLEAPALLLGDRTYVPVRFVAEILGADVAWDHPGRTVIINTSDRETVGYQVIPPQSIEDNQDLYSWYQANHKTKGFHFISDDDAAYVLVAAGEKPTGGYGVDVEGVYLEGTATALVEACITSPAPDMMVIQVITYPSILIKLDAGGIVEARGRFAGDERIPGGYILKSWP